MEQDKLIDTTPDKDSKKRVELDSSGFIPYKEPEISRNGALIELQDIFGLLKTLPAAPTYTPTRFSQQIVLAVAGGNNSLYVYDVTSRKWRAATLGT